MIQEISTRICWRPKQPGRKSWFENVISITVLLAAIGILHSPPLTAATLGPETAKTKATTKDTTIYLVKHAWHTGLIISTEDLNNLAFLLPEFSKLNFNDLNADSEKTYPQKNASVITHDSLTENFGSMPTLNLNDTNKSPETKIQYFEFAWGDAKFYQTEVITIYNTLRALFWPTDSVLHIVALDRKPQNFFPESDVIEITIPKQGVLELSKMLRSNFHFNQENEPEAIAKGLYGESYFFKSDKIYSVFNTCNKWSAHHLEAAGIPMDPTLTFTSDDVMNQVRNALNQ